MGATAKTEVKKTKLRAWEVTKLEAEIMAAQMAKKTGSQVVWGAFLDCASWNEFRRHELLYEWANAVQTLLFFKSESATVEYIRWHELGGKWIPRPIPLSSMSAFAVKVVTDLDEPPLIFCAKEQDFVDTRTGEVSRRPVPWAQLNYNKWVFREIARDVANFLETLVSKTGEPPVP